MSTANIGKVVQCIGAVVGKNPGAYAGESSLYRIHALVVPLWLC